MIGTLTKLLLFSANWASTKRAFGRGRIQPIDFVRAQRRAAGRTMRGQQWLFGACSEGRGGLETGRQLTQVIGEPPGLFDETALMQIRHQAGAEIPEFG
jgi:hypothetical protein